MKAKLDMKLHILAVGKNMSTWINTGYEEYAKRLPKEYALKLTEIPAVKRAKTLSTAKIKTLEGETLLAKIPTQDAQIIALDEHGTLWDTHKLSKQLSIWQETTQHVIFLIGGPDGLSNSCLDRAQNHWSLSPLTLPHPLVRLVLVEQLYRAHTLLIGHPYHRN